MGTFLLGILVLSLVVFGLHLFVNANPAKLARGTHTFVGVAALGLSGLLAMRGMWVIALPLAIFGISRFGVNVPFSSGFGARMYKSPGAGSTVRSEWIEMSLDHDSGNMTGTLLRGEHAGADLDALDVEALIALFRDMDAESAALLEAYLDRRSPGWREDHHADAGGGQGEGGPVFGPMTQEEAYEILGLAPGASEADIRSAHRTLMKRMHPDRGGSTYLAAKINEAKDLLLNTHN